MQGNVAGRRFGRRNFGSSNQHGHHLSTNILFICIRTVTAIDQCRATPLRASTFGATFDTRLGDNTKPFPVGK
jgi:hypothetical protein